MRRRSGRPHPDPACRAPRGDLTAGRAGLRGDVPPRRRRRRSVPALRERARRRWATPWSSSAARALERPRARRRRRRGDRGRHRGRAPPPGPGHPLRRAAAAQAARRPAAARARAARSSRSPPGPAWPRCSPRPARWSSRAGPGGGPRPGQLLEAITACGAARGRRAAQRRRLGARGPDRGPHRRGATRRPSGSR